MIPDNALDFGYLSQSHLRNNLYTCGCCGYKCTYAGVPLPNFCQRCGIMYTSISKVVYLKEDAEKRIDIQEEMTPKKEAFWKRIARKLISYEMEDIIHEPAN